MVQGSFPIPIITRSAQRLSIHLPISRQSQYWRLAMQAPIITLSPAQWQQAIQESWPLCPDDRSCTAVHSAIAASDYLYFSTMRHGVAQHHQQLRSVRASLMTHPCWCFYQEVGHTPALEDCLFIPQATQQRSVQEWTQLISDLGLEAFVSGTASGHHLWQRTTPEDHYRPTTLSTSPRAITTKTLKQLVN